MKRPALHDERVGVLRMAFWVRNVFGTFEKRAPGHPSRAGSVSPETALSSAELTRSFCCELADQMSKIRQIVSSLSLSGFS